MILFPTCYISENNRNNNNNERLQFIKVYVLTPKIIKKNKHNNFDVSQV